MTQGAHGPARRATLASAQASAHGPVQVQGEVLSNKRAGAYHQLTLVASGVAERFRPGTLVALAVGGPLSDRMLRRGVAIARGRATGAYRSTVEVVLDPTEPGQHWLVGLPAGASVDVVGPLGRPFALPKEPVTCLLVGAGHHAAPLFALAERLRERVCAVHMVLTAATDRGLFGALDAKRAARTVVVTTEDGSVGMRGGAAQVLPDLLRRTGAEVVYAAGPAPMLHDVAAAAEAHGAWSQALVETPLVCATGSCQICVLPAVGEDGVSRMVRACAEGPVFRGDRVRWADLGTVPADAWGAGGGS